MNLERSTLTLAAPIAAAVLLMGVTCYYQGVWSERWSDFPELEIFAEQLPNIPETIGEWQGEDAGTSDERVLRISGAVGELNRVYTNPAGEQVRVMIMCARYRDVFHHSPDRCYPAAGFEMMEKPHQEVFDLGNTEAQFFTTTFLKSEHTGTYSERGYWTWSADGEWLAPNNERVTFAGARVLYKLYVFGSLPPGSRGRTDHDFCGDFIRVFIPAATTALSPAFAEVRKGEVAEASPQPEEAQDTEAEPAA